MACRQIHDSAVLLYPFGRIMLGKMMLLRLQLYRFVSIGVHSWFLSLQDIGCFYVIKFVSLGES